MSKLERGKTRIKGFSSAEMEFQLLRQLGSCSYGGASVGECLAAAARIVDGDPSSWVDAFAELGEHEENDARKRAGKGHFISARDQFLKASNSYRAAEYYTYSDGDKHRDLGMKSRECFHEAMSYAAHTFESILLPYKEIQLPVYFMAPDAEAKKRKTLLIVSGYDGTLEEEYLMRGKAALERGMNVILFAGPGQMDTLRYNPDTHFEPDFENPVKVVVDFCAARPEVDLEHLALLGISFGGYFATRAAAFEKRLTALIANSPIVNLHHYMTAFAGEDLAKVEDFRLEDIPGIPEKWMSKHDKIMTANLIKRFGQSTFKDTFDYLNAFNVEHALSNIQCPCFAMLGVGEGEEPKRQSLFFSEKVSGPVDSYVFTEPEGADAHCQAGNTSFAASVFLDWLEEQSLK
ncbi:MAG: prolyl oligopeptidase family serine peptidase [Waddliaceae bacterium]